MKGKQSRLPFKYPGKRAKQRLDLIHSDVCGPFEEKSHSGARFFVTFVDDFSRNVTVVPIAAKSDVFDEFKKYKSLVENQCSRKIKVFRTDNGTEYSSREFQKFLTEHGIKHEKTAPYTPEQGGVAERINRSIVERIRCMLIDARLCKQFWAEASVTAAYLLNRIPCRGNDKTPEEMWTNVKPDLSYLRVFGCRAMVHVPKQKRLKLDEKSTECVLMGYSNESKAYRLYNKTTKKIVISRDVVFFEDKIEINETNINEMKNLLPSTVLQSKCKVGIGSEDANFVDDQLTSEREHADTLSDGHAPEASTEEAATNQSPSLPEVSSLDSSGVYADDLHDSCYTPDEDTSTLERIRFSIRQQGRNKPNYLPPKYSFMASEEQKCDPLSYNEAMFSAEARHWKEAMKTELDALKACGTWELVNLPSGKRVIGSKWVFKVKRDADGNVCKYKARVVAKGYTQIEGIDYKETYAPVVRYTSIRILIAMAAKLNLRIRQMDAVTAFLNGKLEEDVYMKQPEGCDDGTKRVCKLKRSLYGLKQSSRVWNERLNESLLHFGLVRSEIDQCVYFFPSEKKTLIVAIYVDDVLILSNDSVMEDKLKSNLCHNFRMKDLGEASSILGIRITRNNDHSTISLDQKHYLLDVLKRFNMLDCNPISTPLDPNQKLTKSQCPTETADIEEMSQKPYMQAVGSLLFAAQLTRPDIAYAVNMLSRFGTNPGKAHWAAVKRVLRYVKGTIDKRLTYQKEHSEVEGYCDADHAGNLDTAQTTTGYVFLLQGGAVS